MKQQNTSKVCRSKLAKGKAIKTLPITKKKLGSLLKAKFARGKKNQAAMTQTNKKLLASLKQEDFKCSICLETMVQPHQLECGHMFCYMCTQELSKLQDQGNRCPICRKPIAQNPSSCDMIQKIIPIITKPAGESGDQNQYSKRHNQMLSVFAERRAALQKLEVRSLLQCKVENRWTLGKIISIKPQKNGDKIIEVVTKNRVSECTTKYSKIEYSSFYPQYLAPLRTFTDPSQDFMQELLSDTRDYQQFFQSSPPTKQSHPREREQENQDFQSASLENHSDSHREQGQNNID